MNYDDVDHETVDKEVQAMVATLNGADAVARILRRLAEPTARPRSLDAQLIQDEAADLATEALTLLGRPLD